MQLFASLLNLVFTVHPCSQEELAVANFTQESKVGRQLMAKCRSLATENEEMGHELAEGKVCVGWFTHCCHAHEIE